VFGSHAAGIEVTNGGGGEIHDNEIFDNRFEGICLATGVKPTVSGNRVHGNGRTLKDALCSGKCLFSISGDNSYPMHDFYRCLTCDSSESDAICANCVKSCHRDHRVQFVRHDRFFCDCGAGALGCDCVLTGYRAYSSPKISRNMHNHGNASQPNIAVHQLSTSTS
jgi:F-box protein 11